MTSRLMDRLGEWNPQFARELKGRLTGRNVTLAVGLSIVSQLLIFLAFFSQIPGPEDHYNAYCLSQDNSPCLINWMQWWEDLNQVFYWILPLVLVSGGVYLLIADLAREERRGTLNFIRVSPQSSQSILIGKLLGVPVLLYLVVAVALPSYAATAMVAQIPLLEVLSFYVVLAAFCSLFYSAAVLFALMGGHHAFVGAGVTLGMLWWLMYHEFHYYGNNWASHQWFGFPLNGDNLFNVRLFALLNCALWTYWIWQGLHRRFHNPATTMISKKQSYALVFCVNILFLGLVTSYLGSEPDPKLSDAYLWFDRLSWIATLNLFLFLGLIAALSPPRQTLLDWARYAHQANRQSVLQDLIWGEKSPAPVAIAICVIITALVFIPWVLLWPLEIASKLQAIAAVCIYVILTAIYAVLAQIMLLLKSKKRALWATGAVAAAIGVPLLILALFGGQPETIPELFLLSILSLSGLEYATTTPIFLAFLGHLAILAGLSFKLRQQLNLAGESATKALLMGKNVS
ncbi:hypothetical protein [Oscillatoria acuminata]|uniref:Uncharacterized protein n=1 Tax=Oscillatoria acuminata PCC 6304 TaxID=56110 RepID=K9TGE6_9CYAN|nr:hypothetical protein [Oscillatoria acuminata]AFY81927.1 hypothetical protein Oscil6304_2295 [Oscillatoria acuminata PCC 6304]